MFRIVYLLCSAWCWEALAVNRSAVWCTCMNCAGEISSESEHSTTATSGVVVFSHNIWTLCSALSFLAHLLEYWTLWEHSVLGILSTCNKKAWALWSSSSLGWHLVLSLKWLPWMFSRFRVCQGVIFFVTGVSHLIIRFISILFPFFAGRGLFLVVSLLCYSGGFWPDSIQPCVVLVSKLLPPVALFLNTAT